MSAIARRLGKHGYVVLNATYRSAPEWQHSAQYNDLIQALKWMRANGQELNLDPQRLATFGYSAGGHLALQAGLKANKVENQSVWTLGLGHFAAFILPGNAISKAVGFVDAHLHPGQ